MTVTPRKVLWLLSEQLRFQFLPVLHRLQGLNRTRFFGPSVGLRGHGLDRKFVVSALAVGA
jgi:hypothetical protein